MVEFMYQLMDFHSPSAQSARHTVHPIGLSKVVCRVVVQMLPLLLLSQFVNVREESANTQTEKWFHVFQAFAVTSIPEHLLMLASRILMPTLQTLTQISSHAQT